MSNFSKFTILMLPFLSLSLNDQASAHAHAQSLSPESSLVISGQVNAVGFAVDDGVDTDFFFADNDNAMSYLKVAYNIDINSRMSVASQIEIAFSPNNSTLVRQDSQGDNINSGDIQRVEVGVTVNRLGTFTVGKGSMASDETTEYDLSDTSIIIYSLASGIGHELHYRRLDIDDALTTVMPYNTSNPQIGSNVDNLDGADQIVRFRYDTPDMCGFRVATSIGENEIHDLALHFSNSPNQNGIEVVEGGLGYTSAITFEPFGPNSPPYRGNILSGSFSVLLQNGFNITIAGATIHTNTINTIGTVQVGHKGPRYFYTKVGYKRHVNKVGQTAIGVDYGVWQHLAQNEARTEVVGIGVNQQFEMLPGLEVYGGWRYFHLSHFKGDTMQPMVVIPYHNLSWFGIGASFSFEKTLKGVST